MLPSAQNAGMGITGSPFPPEAKPPKAPAAPLPLGTVLSRSRPEPRRRCPRETRVPPDVSVPGTARVLVYVWGVNLPLPTRVCVCVCALCARACAAAPGRPPPLALLLHGTNFAFKLKARRKRDITLIWPRMCGGLAFQNIYGGGWGEEFYFTGFSAISFRGRGCD